MKIKLIALFLVLTLTAWAQTAVQQAPTQDKPAVGETKDATSCCHGMKHQGAEGMSCCKHEAKTGQNNTMSCCQHEGKGMSCCNDKSGKMNCMKAEKDKSAKCCGGDAGCCKDAKGCCGESKDDNKTSMNCCGAKCERRAHVGM